MRHWISEDEPDALLADFLAAVCLSAGFADELPDATVGDRQTTKGLFSFALARQEGFAAIRMALAAGGVFDVACVRVSGNQVRLLASERVASEQATLLLAEFRRLSPSVREARRPLPSFVELLSLLGSRGGLSATSADTAGELTDLRLQLDYYREALREHADELRQLKAQRRGSDVVVDPVRFASRDAVQGAPASERTLADVPGWYAENSDRIVLLPRALNGCKKSLYEDAAALFVGLEFLSGPYREGRLGRLSKDEVQAALEASGLRLAGSTTSTVAGSQGDTYFVPWRGRKRFLDLHLLKGGGRDERFCLRMYFFWCEESELVVVGSMPAHLDNSLS